MSINFTGHKKIEVTDPLREYTTKKLKRVQRHFDNITSIQVTFSKERESYIAEATLHVPGSEFHASSENKENMYSAVDLLIDKLDRQIVKHKEKGTEHR